MRLLHYVSKKSINPYPQIIFSYVSLTSLFKHMHSNVKFNLYVLSEQGYVRTKHLLTFIFRYWNVI